ncbi:hypothetical protein LMIY3S_03680 [Labrys miyagiensis]
MHEANLKGSGHSCLRNRETLNPKVETKLNQLSQSLMRHLIAEIAIPKKLDNYTCPAARRSEVSQENFVRYEPVHQIGEPIGEPLVSDIISDAVSPSRILVVARQGSSLRSLPGFPDPMSNARLQSERGGDFCRVQGRVHNEQFHVKASLRAVFGRQYSLVSQR